MQAIRDPNIRVPASGLVQHALEALGDLHRLDESLYERFMEGGGRVTDDAAPDALLRRLQTITFRGLRSLLVYCLRIRPKDAKVEAAPESMGDFDFGALDDSPSTEMAAAEPAFEFKDSDIGDLLEIIDEHEVAGESERWSTLLEKVSAIEYGLRSQLRDLEERLETSLTARQVGQALEALDDTRSSTSEGIFAMLSAVYEGFLPEIDPATVAPGHLTSLGRALLVRRGLTDLMRAVSPRNEVLQSDKAPPEKKQRALDKLRATITGFVGSDVFRAMRPADRWELTKFERTLRGESPPGAYMIAEGLAKYLESLGSVNRREVLIAHDERALEELRESLSAARPLLEINQGVAADLVRRAYGAAISLYGRNPGNDDLIIALRDAAPSLENRPEIEATAGTLELLLAEEPH